MRKTPLFKIFSIAIVAASVVLVGCGNDDDDASGVEAGASSEIVDTGESSTVDGEDSDSSSEGDDSTSGEVDEDGGFGADGDAADLPGEVLEVYPYEGAELAVVGVEAGDTLNVRSIPGVDGDVVTELDPLATGLVASGHNRSVDDALWVEVSVGSDSGWVNGAYVSHLGESMDVTADLPDPTLYESTIVNLIDTIVAQRSGESTTATSVTVAETYDDSGADVTIDILGFQDDSVAGERIRIIAGPSDRGAGYELISLDVTPLCSRGVSEGLCL